MKRGPQMARGVDAARLAATLLAGALAWSATADVEVLHRERSLYQTILITRQPTRLCLRFSVRRNERNQSCVNPKQPQRLVFTYTRMMLASLLLVPEPKNVLVVGLGGGTLPTALVELLPAVHVDAVEIDPAVLAVAESYFHFAASERLRVHLQDARVFVKRAPARDRRYDVIMLDAYSGDYIPEHLMTREFLEETRGLLTPGGVVAANTFSASRLYDHESETYRAVFGMFFNFKLPGSGNRIILASNAPLPSKAQLRDNAKAWRSRLRPYDVPIRSYPERLSLEVDWDASKRPLSDQYSPANLLREQE